MMSEAPKWERGNSAVPPEIYVLGGGVHVLLDEDEVVTYLNALEAYKRWAEDEAKPALETCTKGMMPIGPAYEAMQALAAYPKPAQGQDVAL
jgi:hypothetical protein